MSRNFIRPKNEILMFLDIAADTVTALDMKLEVEKDDIIV